MLVTNTVPSHSACTAIHLSSYNATHLDCTLQKCLFKVSKPSHDSSPDCLAGETRHMQDMKHRSRMIQAMTDSGEAGIVQPGRQAAIVSLQQRPSSSPTTTTNRVCELNCSALTVADGMASSLARLYCYDDWLLSFVDDRCTERARQIKMCMGAT